LKKYLVFGSSGALGQEIVTRLRKENLTVVETTRDSEDGEKINTRNARWPEYAKLLGPFDGVVWAQGVNSSDTILSAERGTILNTFDSNVLFIVDSLQALVRAKALNNPSRTVVISSIWQDSSRSSKFSYSVSKSALRGLVQSAAIDLAIEGIAMNAVLPGVIDTPMTRANLSEAQIVTFRNRSLGGNLANPAEVAEAVSWLLSSKSLGVNGETIKVDHGWSINSGS